MTQRLIKFRAWDDIQNKMIYKGFAIRCEDNVYSGEFLDGIDNELWQRPSNSRRIDRTFLMQYTGLLDKNGKEIYEGDFIGVHYVSEDGIAYYFTAEMPEVYTRLALDKWEVLGNIYENPELIKD